MKKLIIINGTMGVGKSTVSKELNQRLKKSIWLDGDWCWMMNPWDFSEENKSMVLDKYATCCLIILRILHLNMLYFAGFFTWKALWSQYLKGLMNMKFKHTK